MVFLTIFNGLGIFFGIIGTWIMSKNTFGFEQLSYYGSTEEGLETQARNDKRGKWQKIGLRVLMIGFILQLVPILIKFVAFIYTTFIV